MASIDDGLSEERLADLPDEVFDFPHVPEEYQFFLTAFNDLSSDRQLGFGGIGCISWTAINSYLRAHDADHDSYFAGLCMDVIRRIDAAYVNDANKDVKK